MHRDREGRRRGVRWAAALLAAAAVGLPVGGCSTRSSEDLTTLTSSEATSATPTASPSTSRMPAPPPVEVDKPPTSARVEEPALRKELLARLVQDQAVRTGVAPPGDPRTPDELSAAWDETDRKNTARMARVLDEHGWPGWRLVGSDGAFAAWVLVQHADLDLPLQERALELMTAAVAAGDADPSDHAYLVDRVRVARGEPQVFGTQWGSDAEGNPQPRTPIEDEARVDVRRAAVGLGTLDAYLEELADAP